MGSCNIMARLVIRISDNGHPDPKLNAMRTQIGDASHEI